MRSLLNRQLQGPASVVALAGVLAPGFNDEVAFQTESEMIEYGKGSSFAKPNRAVLVASEAPGLGFFRFGLGGLI